MSDSLKIKGPVRDRLDPGVVAALENAILDDAYAGKEPAGKDALLQFAAVSSLSDEDKDLKGRLLSDFYQANAAGFTSLSAWSKELRTQAGVMPLHTATSSYSSASLPVPVPRSPKETNGHTILNGTHLPVLVRRNKNTGDDTEKDDVEDKSTPADESFVSEFRAVAIIEDETREQELQLREEIAEQSDPVAETEAIMQVDNPYARVISAASTIRAGRRVHKSGLQFLKR